MEKIDVAVIGAGALGLATARALAKTGREVVVIESENRIGSVTSARNSGVIHAGIYYPENSAKAHYCVRGKSMLYHYANDRNIPYKNCGKLIAAVDENDIQKLRDIKNKAAKCGVTDLCFLSKDAAIDMEPELHCTSALYSPSTGIIDVHAFLAALLNDLENTGGILALKNTVQSGEVKDNGLILNLSDGSVFANLVVNAAGLAAQFVSHQIDGLNPKTIPAQYFAKGNYFSISGAAPFSHLVYPVPVPGGLGAHFTMNMAGESLFGPDVEWLNEHDYRAINYDVDPRLANQFKEAVRRYWPGIESRTLNPAYSGVRPKLSMPGGPDSDFMIQTKKDHGVSGLINLYGIESPGITSCLAIADDIAKYATS